MKVDRTTFGCFACSIIKTIQKTMKTTEVYQNEIIFEIN